MRKLLENASMPKRFTLHWMQFLPSPTLIISIYLFLLSSGLKCYWDAESVRKTRIEVHLIHKWGKRKKAENDWDFPYVHSKVGGIKGKISGLLAAIDSLNSSKCLTSVSVTFKANGNSPFHNINNINTLWH